MIKIKETITALFPGENPAAVHIKRKEHDLISYDRLNMILKCIAKVSIFLSVTVIILNAEILKLIALLVFGIFFTLIYFGMKD